MPVARTIPVVFVLALGMTGACLFAQQTPSSPAAPSIIQMTARKYEFDPAVVKVKQGDRVKLVITATDRTHGIRISAFNINQRLEKGVTATVEFNADRAGTFAFECSVMCGLGHHKMKGEIIVEPAAPSSGSRSSSTVYNLPDSSRTISGINSV